MRQMSFLIAFTIIAIMLAVAQYLQFYVGVNPCPMCILQRLIMGILGLLFLFGVVFGNKRCARLPIALLSILSSIGGILLAGRQVWLQHLPAGTSPNCEVSLQYMLSVLPLKEVAQKIFEGSTNCSQIGWEFLHLSLAQWSLAAFIVLLIFSLWQLRRD